MNVGHTGAIWIGCRVSSGQMFIQKVQQLWRELFEGAPFESSMRATFARRVVSWMIGPVWIGTCLAMITGIATLGQREPYRTLPAFVAIPGLIYVTYLARKEQWLRAAGALCMTGVVTVGIAVMLNGVFAPIYQGGFVLLAIVVSLYGTRWALVVAGLLLMFGLAAVGLDNAGITSPIQFATRGPRLVLYGCNLVLSVLILGAMQRLLADALREARRKHSEAQAAREAEAASELAFQAVFEQASAGIALLSHTGEITQVNERAARWLGASDVDLLGKTISAAPLWEHAHRVLLDESVQAAAAGKASRHELTVSGSLGVQPVYQVNVAPFRASNGGAGRVIFEIVDVTDLVRTRTMLAQARRLEALGKLSGGVAHDINNMLAAIQGSCDLLRLQNGLDPRRVEMSRDIIQASVTRASALTKQLLAFGRQDRFESVDIDITRLVADMAALFERTLHKNIAINVVSDDRALFVRGDHAALENALLNLALNAQDAMPNGGTLTLRTRSVTELNPEMDPGPAVMIRVSDTGAGMSEAVRERIFEPFFTTKATGKGTGLGLAAVHGTVRNHRGAIVVHSREGVGTTFDLYFPAGRGSKPSIVVPEDRPPSQRLCASVMVADDEPLVRDALVAVLVLAGCEVHAVESGEALIEALASGATPDVIVSDLVMPGLSGKNLVQTLENTRPGCPLLLITGFTGDDVSDVLTGRSSHRLLRKPIAQAELVRALRELLPENIVTAQRAQSA